MVMNPPPSPPRLNNVKKNCTFLKGGHPLSHSSLQTTVSWASVVNRHHWWRNRPSQKWPKANGTDCSSATFPFCHSLDFHGAWQWFPKGKILTRKWCVTTGMGAQWILGLGRLQTKPPIYRSAGGECHFCNTHRLTSKAFPRLRSRRKGVVLGQS